KLHVVPALDFLRPIAKVRRHFRDGRTKGREALCLDLLGRTLGNDIGALPIVAAIEHHEYLAGPEATERRIAVARLSRQVHPEHVDRRAEVVDLEPRALAHD